VFDFLFSKKETIQKAFNRSIEWSRLDNKDASRIHASIVYNYIEKENWPILIELMSDSMIGFHNAISPQLHEFKDEF